MYDCNTSNMYKLRAANDKHNFMYNIIRDVDIQIWHYIIDHLDIKVYFPKSIIHSTIIVSSYDNIIEVNQYTFSFNN